MDNSKKPINRFDTIERNLRLTKRKSMHEQNWGTNNFSFDSVSNEIGIIPKLLTLLGIY